MASVELQFVPPDVQGITTLHVEEAATQGGTYSEVQTFPAGTFPNYIYTALVDQAVSATDWFRIRWSDAAGDFTPYSSPIQGGTTTIVAQITDRVLLRDPSVNAIIAGQEAEATVSWYFGVDDPYSVDPTLANPKILSGLTTMTLARTYTNKLITGGTTAKWSAGLVSMDSSSTAKQSWDAIDKMIELANAELGRNYSLIALIEEVSVAGGYKTLKSFDVSRAMIELA